MSHCLVLCTTYDVHVVHACVCCSDPLQLTKNFGSILANPVIATQVSATFLLHQGLKFRNAQQAQAQAQATATAAAAAARPSSENKMYREIGAVSSDTEITF